MQKVSGSLSTSTGSAPARYTANAHEMIVNVGRITSSPGNEVCHEAPSVREFIKKGERVPANTPLTKTKLDIMLSGYIGGGKSIPAVLRAEFEALSKQDQLTVRNFVNWTRTVDVPWSRRYIENIFTPHTPRPDILIER